ncbi:F-box/WD repeat-containing protein 5-like [Acropora palmata]|uniref:F-box/WD repeat-containing protein 5-like n=1 Tax=Acropora palmata TaxID=6131 RepID=UPI003DA13EBD
MALAQSSSSCNGWNNLTDCLLLRVFGLLTSSKDVLRASEVCQNWYRISRDESLWKDLLQRQSCLKFQGNSAVSRPSSWFEEFKWIHLNTPVLESQVLKRHTDEVLHVSFSNDGKMLASSSKDCKVILWRMNDRYRFCEEDVCVVNFAEEYWDYVQFTEFNKNDTLLLVSGTKNMQHIHFEGEIIIFEMKKEEMLELQPIHKVVIVPYDIFGAWMTERSYISGKLEFAPSGVDYISLTELCLNHVDKMHESQTRLAQIMDYKGSSVRTPLVARPPRSQENDQFCLIFTHGTVTRVPHQIVLRWMQQKQSTSETSSTANIDTALWHTVEEHFIETNGHIIGIKLSPDHQFLYVNCRPWKEALDMKKVGTSFQDSPPDISEEMTLTCYSLATYEKINVHVGHQAFTGSEACFYIFLSVADNLVASGAEDHYAHVWHRQAGGKLATLRGHTNVVNCVAFNPRDQQMLVSASDDHTIRVWKSRQLAKVTEENQQKQEELSPESSV